MGRPVALDVGDSSLPALVQAWVVANANTGIGSVEVVERRRQRRESRRF